MSRDDYRDRVFTSRAVAPDVARERGYRRYAAGLQGRGVILGVDSRLDESPAWLSRALVVGGWVIPKTTLMPDHDQFGWTPYAQLGPDRPVMARRSVHRHDGMAHRHRDDGRCPCGELHTRPPVRRSRWPYRPQDVLWDWYQPPLGKKAKARHETSVCDWAAGGLSLPVDVLDASDGKVLVPTCHLHPDTGEVVLPARGRHAHLEWAKYLYVPGQGKAQRLNTHPRVRTSGYAAPEGVFFFFFFFFFFFVVIEGTLKLDAVVSAGWPGIEAGSVTLWDAYAEDAEAEWESGLRRGLPRR